MADAPTTIPSLTADQFAARQATLVPRDWASDTAKQPGGTMYSLLFSTGSQLSFLITAIQYALSAMRIETETSPELDQASIDFLGNALPRPAGMSDQTFAALIISQLFLPAATREAINSALVNLTGVEPRLLEPWNLADTGAWDAGCSYWDVDTRENPARWSDGSMRYQGFIETVVPASHPLGQNPLNTLDDSGYWDVPGVYMDTIAGVAASGIYSTLNTIKALGITCWVKFVANPQ